MLPPRFLPADRHHQHSAVFPAFLPSPSALRCHTPHLHLFIIYTGIGGCWLGGKNTRGGDTHRSKRALLADRLFYLQHPLHAPAWLYCWCHTSCTFTGAMTTFTLRTVTGRYTICCLLRRAGDVATHLFHAHRLRATWAFLLLHAPCRQAAHRRWRGSFARRARKRAILRHSLCMYIPLRTLTCGII